jgi:hypothetical protein
VGQSTALRYRHNAAIAVAAVVATIAASSLASWAVWLLPLLLVPVAVAIWAWRAGTDVDADGFTVRAALGSRRVAWSEVAELVPDRQGRVTAHLASGSALTLTAVPATDLPRLAATAGHRT